MTPVSNRARTLMVYGPFSLSVACTVLAIAIYIQTGINIVWAEFILNIHPASALSLMISIASVLASLARLQTRVKNSIAPMIAVVITASLFSAAFVLGGGYESIKTLDSPPIYRVFVPIHIELLGVFAVMFLAVASIFVNHERTIDR